MTDRLETTIRDRVEQIHETAFDMTPTELAEMARSLCHDNNREDWYLLPAVKDAALKQVVEARDQMRYEEASLYRSAITYTEQHMWLQCRTWSDEERAAGSAPRLDVKRALATQISEAIKTRPDRR